MHFTYCYFNISMSLKTSFSYIFTYINVTIAAIDNIGIINLKYS